MAAHNGSRRRWRYVVLVSALMTVVPIILVGLLAGGEPGLFIVLALVLLGATLSGDLAIWWLAGDRLRAQGWEW